ncbi:MAG: hypothetical protein HY774_01165 [Acidobacteria bacterium]|nr:hypothetical protein [Acidobacteriota bacterium]
MTEEYPYEIHPRRLVSEFSMLWTMHQFFASLQATMLKTDRGLTVDMMELYQRMENWRSAREVVTMPGLQDTAQKLNQARVEISMIDNQLPPAMFRRFFERVPNYDRSLLHQIVRFYITKIPKDGQDRDKLDLLATRLCTYITQTEHGTKVMSAIENTPQVLEEVFPGNAADYPPASIQEATLTSLRRLAKSVSEVRNFNTLIDGRLVTQLRQCKIDLGESFYTPSILTEVILINVIVHNKFQELYGMEQARLRMESARLMRSSLTTGRYPTAGSQDRHPTLGQLIELNLQMQRLIQDFKQEIAARALNDRQTRVNLEDEGLAVTNLVRTVEDALRRSRELVDEIQGRLNRMSQGEE